MSSEVSNPSGLAAKVNKKRKRQSEEPLKQNKPGAPKPIGNASEGPKDKKRKHGKNKKDKKDQEDKPKVARGEPLVKERKGGMDEAIGKMDGRLLADHFVQKAKRHNKELTAVELSDLSVPDSAFLDTSSFDSPRTLEKLPDFLKAFSPKGVSLLDSSEQKGTPHTLVVSPAGLRAADVVRALRTFSTKESPIGKLFAKHIKLEEAKQFLERARVGIGAGTPSRISDLIDSGSLKLNELKRIVIDGSYVDQKQRGIFDMKETHLPLLQLLTRSEFRDRYGAKDKKIEILVF
ncbi:U3-containing 90S pre-ribosomal complex subunit-domain containing protein [Aspergillus granulosus]|uniref:U3-containing 90S pre-ribosomal complex subunit-domain containing protein n=1 Tax=Aspergillus granulosus TaxID=176169 RepID=A0ABR4HN48_9EURO